MNFHLRLFPGETNDKIVFWLNLPIIGQVRIFLKNLFLPFFQFWVDITAQISKRKKKLMRGFEGKQVTNGWTDGLRIDKVEFTGALQLALAVLY